LFSRRKKMSYFVFGNKNAILWSSDDWLDFFWRGSIDYKRNKRRKEHNEWMWMNEWMNEWDSGVGHQDVNAHPPPRSSRWLTCSAPQRNASRRGRRCGGLLALCFFKKKNLKKIKEILREDGEVKIGDFEIGWKGLEYYYVKYKRNKVWKKKGGEKLTSFFFKRINKQKQNTSWWRNVHKEIWICGEEIPSVVHNVDRVNHNFKKSFFFFFFSNIFFISFLSFSLLCLLTSP